MDEIKGPKKLIYFDFSWLAFCKYEKLFSQYNDDNNNNIKDDNNITTNNAYICMYVCLYNKITIIIWNTEFS